ncbi:MAG: PASTA domain-containing protein, partial [Candidatus Hydrogenedentes bacterium]|nr:PASTA domain-containing protein [Candidatus Hydrogenedentota bacterium]
ATAGSTTFTVATTAAWTAASNQGWATVTPVSGTGDKTLTVNYTANTGAQRTATITVTGTGTNPATKQVTVVQAPPPPALDVTPASRSVGATAGSTTFTVATTAAWTAASNQGWATVTPVSGTGDKTLTVNYTANTGAQRTATITVTGTGTNPATKQVTVVQAPPPPALDVTPASRSVGATAGSTTFTVATTAAWTAASNQGWATVTPVSGTGDKTLTVNYTANTGAQRTATITVTGTGTSPASKQVTVVQEASQGTGAIKVSIDPSAARSAGARWRVDGGSWRYSGETRDGYAVGTHIVSFSDVAGWDKPANREVTVTSDQIMTILVEYTPKPIVAPNVVGQTQSAAQTTISGIGLTVGIVTQEYHNTIAYGRVISQNPVPGTEVSRGSAVNLVISRGPSTHVPNVEGMTRTAAEAAITASGLTLGSVNEENSNTVPNGVILAQSPAAWTEVSLNTLVSLVVSKGPRPSVIADTRTQLAVMFGAADTNNDGRLSYSEALAAYEGLTEIIFDVLDLNGDGLLDKEELGMLDSESCAGCNCVKADFTVDGLKKRLGDFFVAGLGLGLLALMGRRRTL